MSETVIFDIISKKLGDQLTVYTDKVVIRHKGILNFFSMGIQGSKTIYFRNITSVQYKKPGALSGYIQFSIAGGNESSRGLTEAMGDENTVALAYNNNYDYDKIVDYINHRIRALTEPAAPIVQTSSATPADEIRKYKQLLDDGIITQEEFDEKKNRLLQL